jgi:hypothetical protein
MSVLDSDWAAMQEPDLAAAGGGGRSGRTALGRLSTLGRRP